MTVGCIGDINLDRRFSSLARPLFTDEFKRSRNVQAVFPIGGLFCGFHRWLGRVWPADGRKLGGLGRLPVGTGVGVSRTRQGGGRLFDRGPGVQADSEKGSHRVSCFHSRKWGFCREALSIRLTVRVWSHVVSPER